MARERCPISWPVMGPSRGSQRFATKEAPQQAPQQILGHTQMRHRPVAVNVANGRVDDACGGPSTTKPDAQKNGTETGRLDEPMEVRGTSHRANAKDRGRGEQGADKSGNSLEHTQVRQRPGASGLADGRVKGIVVPATTNPVAHENGTETGRLGKPMEVRGRLPTEPMPRLEIKGQTSPATTPVTALSTHRLGRDQVPVVWQMAELRVLVVPATTNPVAHENGTETGRLGKPMEVRGRLPTEPMPRLEIKGQTSPATTPVTALSTHRLGRDQVPVVWQMAELRVLVVPATTNPVAHENATETGRLDEP
eukprot:CAMPEP_0119116258 /NCGR_PEP_ID=MMETSP1180-20130426/52185_1 /TAXON_ID=3052 ORGANISM="Chlamydomonas cf sp, Strain CCMP681" /NCGR_SAMPLE_ID=MMETSP1180 /ASSEMBLY_ACC=CAM_ASM_000741 /LENGTH=308 /DNA_ID=CAMNT_0007105385 /DNA_START=826 /DNA_END=1751 /DNA_ORIENTATION=+